MRSKRLMYNFLIPRVFPRDAKTSTKVKIATEIRAKTLKMSKNSSIIYRFDPILLSLIEIHAVYAVLLTKEYGSFRQIFWVGRFGGNESFRPRVVSVLNLNLNLNSLLVKRQIDNPSPGAVTGGN